VCGALIGVCLFFRGFSLLQRASPAPANSPNLPALPATATMTTTTTFRTEGSDPLTGDTHFEIIRLSVGGNEPDRAVSMSQQGKIAAALLRAGIPNPASWSTPAGGAPVSVKTANSRAGENSTNHLRQTLELNRSQALKPGADSRSLPIATRPHSHTRNGKPAFMLWGGALLGLASIYAIAALLGWL
jgi:hypothetical protein